jgi:hypothetical protein
MAKGTCPVVEDGEVCGKPIRGHGYCGKHYQRWQKWGAPYRPAPAPLELDLPGEYWVPVVDYEDLYKVSSLGRVSSLDRTIRYRDGRTRFYPGVILNPCVNSVGYLYVGLSRDGKTTPLLVHWLVSAAFLGPRPDGYQTLLGPAGQLDNSVSSLSYGTPAQNVADTLRDGTRAMGTRLPHAKLTDDIVRECRRRHEAGGVMIKSLAEEFGVDKGTMHSAVRGKTWKHVAA